jgi:2,3-bisphosphoglycerate-independent phosphoglycerate mutase
MKYVLIIPDGCADEPQESLDGKTPLEAANTPNMDEVAKRGRVGMANHVPPHLPPGSDVANMSLLGYDPNADFTGRAPLEAAAQGIQLGENDWAIRCNLVCVQDQIMKDFTAGHISTEEATELLATAQAELGGEQLEFVPGVSYRNLLLYRDGRIPAPFSQATRATPPHDLTDKTVVDDFPRGPGSSLLVELMSQSQSLFAEHAVNKKREEANKLPATNVWLWGIGKSPSLPSFKDQYGIASGAMITAVDLLRGLAKLIGWDVINVEGATGYLDTDYAAKGRAGIAALGDHDFVTVHIEAPDEASHEGRTDAKMEALAEIDAKIVAPMLAHLDENESDWRLIVTPDHPTPVRTKTHSHGAVPFAYCGSNVEADAQTAYNEPTCEASGLKFEAGFKLMKSFLGV